MFVDFFFNLRKSKVPVSLNEWMTLMTALVKGLSGGSLINFYFIARAILIKDVAHYDIYDNVFAHTFKDLPLKAQLSDALMQWLENPVLPPNFSDEERKLIDLMKLDELRQLFEERLKEQTERHDGGDRWIGTGGTSPFGHSGHHPGGIRVGGSGGGLSAMQIAHERRFKNYRSDLILDTRQLQVALKKLRRLKRSGAEDELDLEETIDQTCKNAGEIEVVLRKPRHNESRLLLLMDAGGSMIPYARLVSMLFSAAHSLSHFKEFHYYYFHNCIYEEVYKNIYMGESIPTAWLLKNLGPSFDVIVIGDASMGPWELTEKHGAIYYSHFNDTPGIVWLNRIKERFARSVWLNPLPERAWYSGSVGMIKGIFPMFELTVKGIEEAVSSLLSTRC